MRALRRIQLSRFGGEIKLSRRGSFLRLLRQASIWYFLDSVSRPDQRWSSPARKELRVPGDRGLATLKEVGQAYGGVGKCSRPSGETFQGGVSTRQANQHLAPANKDGLRSDAARSGSAESLPP